MEKVCVDMRVLTIIILAIVFIGMYQYIQIVENKNQFYQKRCPRAASCPPCPVQKCEPVVKEVVKEIKELKEEPVVVNTVDPVREYDLRKIHDPLTEPTRRVPRHHIHPAVFKQYIDIPTRGYPDNYTQIGVLIRKEDGGNDNKILRLFGRQEYPGSSRYEYYTAVNSTNDQIKVPIEVRGNKELYDDDEVTVTELNEVYTVKMHKFDAPKYYPDIY